MQVCLTLKHISLITKLLDFLIEKHVSVKLFSVFIAECFPNGNKIYF